VFNKNIIEKIWNIGTNITPIKKSLLNQNILLEEAFAKGGNSDKVNLIPSLAVIISEPILKGKVQAHGYYVTFILSKKKVQYKPDIWKKKHIVIVPKTPSDPLILSCYCHL